MKHLGLYLGEARWEGRLEAEEWVIFTSEMNKHNKHSFDVVQRGC